jgi:hypothetical protein
MMVTVKQRRKPRPVVANMLGFVGLGGLRSRTVAVVELPSGVIKQVELKQLTCVEGHHEPEEHTHG